MSNEPIDSHNSAELTARLTQLHHLRSYYVRIGHTATKALLRTQSLLSRDVTVPGVSSFVQSLSSLRTVSALKPRTAKEIGQFIERTNEVIAKATTVFPLTLFPDTVVLDRTKLTVTRRGLFSADVMSIRIEDILNVSSVVGPLFGSLTIATRVLSSDDHFMIRNFTREDAIHLKHVIQGFVIARHNNILCDHLSREELIEMLMELGRDSNKDAYRPRVVTAPQRLL